MIIPITVGFGLASLKAPIEIPYDLLKYVDFKIFNYYKARHLYNLILKLKKCPFIVSCIYAICLDLQN